MAVTIIGGLLFATVLTMVVDIAYSVLGILFFVYITALIPTDVFRDSVAVSTDTICGALTAYLLIGIGWAFAYALLDQLVPGSISGLRSHGGPTRYDEYLGYSFVALTTLGYGNVVPANAKADALAGGKAIVGQSYLTVLVALNLAASRLRGEDDGDPKQTDHLAARTNEVALQIAGRGPNGIGRIWKPALELRQLG